MAAVRECRRLAGIHSVAVETVFESGQLVALQRHRKFADRDRAIRAAHCELADSFDDLKADFAPSGLQHLPSSGLALLDHFVGRNHQRAARHVERARAAGAAAVHPIGVALASP